MRIDVRNKQKSLRVKTATVKRLAKHFLSRANRHVPESPVGSLSVVLVDDRQIQVLNQQFLGLDEPTDVLSFSYDSTPGEGPERSAEVIVNLERVRQIGDTHQGYPRELALYIAHGCNHLTGADDQIRSDRRRMRQRERRWISQADAAGLLADLCETGSIHALPC